MPSLGWAATVRKANAQAAVRINFAASRTSDVLGLTRARSRPALDASRALFYTPARWSEGSRATAARPHGDTAEKRFPITLTEEELCLESDPFSWSRSY